MRATGFNISLDRQAAIIHDLPFIIICLLLQAFPSFQIEAYPDKRKRLPEEYIHSIRPTFCFNIRAICLKCAYFAPISLLK